jgi:hypothetical protein
VDVSLTSSEMTLAAKGTSEIPDHSLNCGSCLVMTVMQVWMQKRGKIDYPVVFRYRSDQI